MSAGAPEPGLAQVSADGAGPRAESVLGQALASGQRHLWSCPSCRGAGEPGTVGFVSITPFPSVKGLLWALEALEGQPIDDVVGALPHLLQTAELLAELHPEDPELVAAGLVHDVASALDLRDGDHGVLGAKLVVPLLGARVGALVAGHVDAKRYLVATDPTYRSILSENSTASLRAQGGAMDRSEVLVFREGADWEAMIALRRADDAAKVPDAAVRPVAEWHGLLEAVAEGRDSRH